MSKFKKPAPSMLKEKLSELQYQVTQLEGTEPPFNNLYWDNQVPGIYVDIVSGEPLFSSLDKFDAHCGWPSFTQPIKQAELIEKSDNKLFSQRTEVRSALADSHLGHVFEDGPAPTGLRYCINSAAIRFIEQSKMAEEGYADLLMLFEV